MSRIGMDLDGVIIDWDTGWRQFWNQTSRSGRLVPPFSRTWEDPFTDTGLSHQLFWSWMDNEDVWAELGPCEDALPALRILKEQGHEVHFITNRHYHGRPATAEWLYSYGLGEYPLTFCKDKSVVKADAYVDDNDENLIELAKNTRSFVIRRVRPWNHQHNCVSDITDLTVLGEWFK